tara:strand:- start:1263 stop:1799 length:537 start_codon:yes stop_codon:yes gene_type:complete
VILQRKNKVIITRVDDIKFYREFDLCKTEDLKNIKEAIDLEFEKGNIVWTHPLYQTWSNLHEKLKHVPSFNILKNKVIKLVKGINKDLKITTCWTNLSTKDNAYGFHSHNTKLTCVFYLQSNQDCYGTRLKKPEIIFPSIQNSILIFDGSVSHSIEHMPNKVFDSINSDRYSVVFDFI